ncbi:amino acid ABC transporter permease [Curtanaerobium respiraculi]|uniref:amino acid ABC transporter permease n=1 Tax=Curtanaerobium respiraculi TaxID=2949669 RepID=UPI0024B37483|nr:amino acid ABC transporter permease [Curtanaerobium respiraculi]
MEFNSHAAACAGRRNAVQLAFGAMAAFLCALVVIAAAPPQAHAMEVSKCTARSNVSSTDNTVAAGTQTRITLEAQAAGAEEVTGLTFTVPNGTAYSAEDSKITLIEKNPTDPTDPGKRIALPNAVLSADGATLTADFGEAAPAGSFIRLEVYGVVFPAEGGDMQCSATYALSDGTVADFQGIPPIPVVGIDPSEALSKRLSEQDWVKNWNSNKFLHLFFDPTVLVTSFPIVLRGFFMALAIVVVSFPLAIPFGLMLALMRMSRLRLLRGLASLYVNIVRGTPLFLQIYIAFFGLPLAGVQIPNFPLGVIVLAMNSCAYQCEIMRAGIQSISKGQFEASRSLGMNGAQTMFSVIIPQTIRRVIPTMTNEFILLYKDTSMLAAVGVMEVVMYAKTIVANTGSITPYIVAACFYLVITIPLARLVGSLERKLASNDSGSAPRKKGRKGGMTAEERQIIAQQELDQMKQAAAGAPKPASPFEAPEPGMAGEGAL